MNVKLFFLTKIPKKFGFENGLHLKKKSYSESPQTNMDFYLNSMCTAFNFMW